MRHFVHGPDGQKYGPADFATLVQWRNEGRLTPSTNLEPEVGGVPFEARNMPGLFDNASYAQPHEQQGTGYADYPYQAQPAINSNNFVVAAWILGVVSICACWPLVGPIAIYCATRAKKLGSPNGTFLIAFTVSCMLIGAAIGITYAVQLIRNGFQLP